MSKQISNLQPTHLRLNSSTRCEVAAIISILQRFHNKTIHIYSDSLAAIKNCQHFMNRSKKFQHITDADLMHQGNWDNEIDFIHVHGHSNNSLNNQCDHLAKTYNTHYPRLALKLNSKTPATTNRKTHDYYRIRDVDHAWSNRRLTPRFLELASHLHHILQDIGNLELHHPTTC